MEFVGTDPAKGLKNKGFLGSVPGGPAAGQRQERFVRHHGKVAVETAQRVVAGGRHDVLRPDQPAALPEEGLPPVNRVADDAIPDVPMTERFAGAVYKLYRAGILTGSDAAGTFRPQTGVTRAEAAAIVSRMAESGSRKSVTLG